MVSHTQADVLVITWQWLTDELAGRTMAGSLDVVLSQGSPESPRVLLYSTGPRQAFGGAVKMPIGVLTSGPKPQF